MESAPNPRAMSSTRRGMKARMKISRRSRKSGSALLAPALVTASLMCGCRRSGPSDFKASQQAFQKISRVKVEWSATTDKGRFKETVEMDCDAPYYHRLSVTDLTENGIASGTRSALGQPLAHQETEDLFIDGKSFDKSTGTWGFDARPDWAPPAGGGYNPTAECQALRDGKDPEDGPFAQGVHFIPVLGYARVLAGNKIEYMAKRTLEGGACWEYRVVYQDSTEASRVSTPNGEMISYEMRPVEATVCLGTTDRLPRQIVQGDWTVKFSYGRFEKLPAAPQPVANTDPEPPNPPNSVEISAAPESVPAMMLLAIGGIVSETGKKNIVVRDSDIRLFRTKASTADVLSFYSGELRRRGWILDGPAASSSPTGLAAAAYRRNNGQQGLFLIIAEPEHAGSNEPKESKRHVALVRGNKG